MSEEQEVTRKFHFRYCDNDGLWKGPYEVELRERREGESQREYYDDLVEVLQKAFRCGNSTTILAEPGYFGLAVVPCPMPGGYR